MSEQNDFGYKSVLEGCEFEDGKFVNPGTWRTVPSASDAVPLTPAEAAALARIREGWVVAPREPSPDMWPTYCAENCAMAGSAWDTLSQKLYRAIIRHYGSKEKANG